MCTEGQEEEESRGLGQKIEKHHRSCCSPTLLLMHTSCLSAHRLPISASLSPNISILAKYAFQSGSVGPSVGQVLVFCIVRPAILSCCPALLSPPLCERHRVPTRLAEVRLHFVPATLHIPALDTEAVGAWCSSTDGLYVCTEPRPNQVDRHLHPQVCSRNRARSSARTFAVSSVYIQPVLSVSRFRASRALLLPLPSDG